MSIAAEEELLRMKNPSKPRRRRVKHLRLYEIDRWNDAREKWEDVVVLAPSERDAQKRVRSTHLKRVEDFL